MKWLDDYIDRRIRSYHEAHTVRIGGVRPLGGEVGGDLVVLGRFVPGAKVDADTSSPGCCALAYHCPTSGESECSIHGGFDVCCDHPELHRPLAGSEAP